VKRFSVVGLLILALAVAACGYQFRGKQNNLPSDVRSIAVPVFKNDTNEIRIEQIFTDAVIFQFTRSQMVQVVSEGQANAVLRGAVKRVDIVDVALTADQTSRQRRITIFVSAKLTRTRDGLVLWQDKNLWQNRTYDVGNTPQATDSNKRQAITLLARELAQTLHDRVFENF
jgi:outer membrane lipopolysaccharide assembly protein LptE/RlpB